MATKRKPKSEPILNAEPLKSDGVIVTHRDRHITPGNASITWLVVMMAIIGVAGACGTYIWWQKEDLSSQIEAPYMHDNGSVMGKVVRSMREKILAEPKQQWKELTGVGLPFSIAYPIEWHASVDFEEGRDSMYHTVSLSSKPFVTAPRTIPSKPTIRLCGRPLEKDETLESVQADFIKSTLTNAQTTTITLDNGVVMTKIVGVSTRPQDEPGVLYLVPYTQYGQKDIPAVLAAYVEPVEDAYGVVTQSSSDQLILDEMMKHFRLNPRM